MDVEPPARSPCSTCTAWVVLCLPAVCEKLDDCLRKLFLRQRVVLGNDRTDQNSKFDRSMICHDLAMIWPSSGHILMLFPVDYSPTWRSLRPPAPSVSPELTPEASLVAPDLRGYWAGHLLYKTSIGQLFFVIYCTKMSTDRVSDLFEKGCAFLMSAAFLEALPCSSGPEFLAPEVWRRETQWRKGARFSNMSDIVWPHPQLEGPKLNWVWINTY